MRRAPMEQSQRGWLVTDLKALAELAEKVKGILPLQADDETFGKILTKSGEYVCECDDILEGDGEEYEPDKDGWTRNSGCDVAAYLCAAANFAPRLLAERDRIIAASDGLAAECAALRGKMLAILQVPTSGFIEAEQMRDIAQAALSSPSPRARLHETALALAERASETLDAYMALESHVAHAHPDECPDDCAGGTELTLAFTNAERVEAVALSAFREAQAACKAPQGAEGNEHGDA